MASTSTQSRIFAVALVAGLALPYSAPSICALLGRMGGEMQMSTFASETVLQTPDAGDTCCNISECGIPQIAFFFDVSDPTDEKIVPTNPAERPPTHLTHARPPVIPPPQA